MSFHELLMDRLYPNRHNNSPKARAERYNQELNRYNEHVERYNRELRQVKNGLIPYENYHSETEALKRYAQKINDSYDVYMRVEQDCAVVKEISAFFEEDFRRLLDPEWLDGRNPGSVSTSSLDEVRLKFSDDPDCIFCFANTSNMSQLDVKRLAVLGIIVARRVAWSYWILRPTVEQNLGVLSHRYCSGYLEDGFPTAQYAYNQENSGVGIKREILEAVPFLTHAIYRPNFETGERLSFTQCFLESMKRALRFPVNELFPYEDAPAMPAVHRVNYCADNDMLLMLCMSIYEFWQKKDFAGKENYSALGVNPRLNVNKIGFSPLGNSKDLYEITGYCGLREPQTDRIFTGGMFISAWTEEDMQRFARMGVYLDQDLSTWDMPHEKIYDMLGANHVEAPIDGLIHLKEAEPLITKVYYTLSYDGLEPHYTENNYFY